ncbi:uncharacterized protein B0H18DRAFT_1103017 [Fomitopsis serialis]|uniref:uncharacterized protein n=1 Tax=Fomitopsis serialis TaxID=139415 RepID=UPI002008BAB2|nr:uncharacterized protein B0H18DRAFT_1103017 [Neoantrodia serialis]KAH9930699.1 hypothetical protein B0H18DRAFT_1103017 [Neoantrodia serialis]
MLASTLPFLLLVTVACARGISASAFYWPNVKHVFSFGDSYTDTYARFVNGTLTASHDLKSTSGGKMWIEWLTDTYNVSTVELYNFARVFPESPGGRRYGGAVTDETIVAQSSSSTQSFRDQVNNFLAGYANNSAVPWTADDSLFTVFIGMRYSLAASSVGINDIGKSYYWTNETQHTTNARVLASYFERLALLRSAGARNFLLLQSAHTAPGEPNNGTLQSLAALDYNAQLAQNIEGFTRNSSALGVSVNVAIHPTHALFDFALDNAEVLGFTNVASGWWTGLADQDQYSAATYFWWNNFHPTWGVHDVLAHSVSTFLSKRSGL